MIKTFRGLLTDGEERTIRLSTIRGERGYRITKFQLFPHKPGTTTTEPVVSVWARSGLGGGVSTAVVDFENQYLLAVAFYQDRHESTYIAAETVIFDRRIINQDIFVTLTNTEDAEKCNYYIELEQIKLDLNEATAATLQDMRGTKGPAYEPA